MQIKKPVFLSEPSKIPRAVKKFKLSRDLTTEEGKIDYILSRIRNSQLKFIRNGIETGGEAAVEFLRWEIGWYKNKYQTKIKPSTISLHKLLKGLKKQANLIFWFILMALSTTCNLSFKMRKKIRRVTHSSLMAIKNRYPFKKSRRWHLIQLCDFFLDWFGTYHSSKQFPQNVKNILVVRLDHIGDLICTLPALLVLKDRFPNAKITVLTGVEGPAILKENPFVDDFITFPSNWFSRLKRFSPGEFFSVVSKLQKMKFDLGYDFRGDMRNILLMVLAGVRFRIGYGIAGGAGLLNQIGEYDEALHQVELNMKLLTGETPDRQNLKPQIFIGSHEQEEAKQILNQAGIQTTDRVIAIHPEAGYPSKEWAEENIQTLILRLTADSHNKVIIFGLSKAEKIAGHFNANPQVLNFVRKFSLRQMIALLSQCDVFIGNDSGPSHIAQALGIPSVIIASGTNEYDKWGIWRKPSEILKYNVPCAPCHSPSCYVEGHPCMSHISVDQVYNSIQDLLVHKL